MIIDKKSGVGVMNGSTKRLLQPADDGHAELMGRYEVTPPDCVTGPYVDISSVVQSHVEEDAGLPGIKRNPSTRIDLAIGPPVPVEDHWRCGGAGTLELQYLYAEPYHKAGLRQSGCAARLIGVFSPPSVRSHQRILTVEFLFLQSDSMVSLRHIFGKERSPLTVVDRRWPNNETAAGQGIVMPRSVRACQSKEHACKGCMNSKLGLPFYAPSTRLLR
jgi:hypothetical protein